MLTKCEDGVLVMDEEIFADLCLLEAKRYEEIRGIFLKRGLVTEDDMHRLVVVNWGEYQVGESTERVRRFREKQRGEAQSSEKEETDPENAQEVQSSEVAITGSLEKEYETACNAPVTEGERLEGEGEVEEEVEKEGEGERASAREAPSPADNPQNRRKQSSGAAPIPAIELATPRKVVEDWFKALSQETSTNALPPPKAEMWAKQVVELVRGDMERVKRLRIEYFRCWRGLWFAVSKGHMSFSIDKRAPDFDFKLYCKHAVAIAARIKVSAIEDKIDIKASNNTLSEMEREEVVAALVQQNKRFMS